MLSKRILQIFLGMLLFPAIIHAQVTTSSISGIVSTDGRQLEGATIKATHVPTGTVYATRSSKSGVYNIDNVNPGGPYTIEVSYVGLKTESKSDIYLTLGESAKNDFVMGAAVTDLGTVVVSASAKVDAGKGGTSTTIGRDKMETLPTVGRGLADFVRTTPQFKFSSGGNASSEGAFSIAGQNVRFNSFYVDGAVNNDVFGLAYSGTNGGQSNVTPLSIDAIDQIQVLLSPYDVSIGNFTGGAINAITKSGTNEVHGSAYYIFRNQDMAGKTPTGDKALATKLNSFNNKTYGLTFGGPLIKNKLFYFVSGEMQRDQSPNVFDPSGYRGDTKTAAAYEQIRQYVMTKGGGYDIGNVNGSLTEVKSDKVTLKLDWNVNDKNKLSASYRYTGGDRLLGFTSNPSELDFSTYGYRFPTKTHSASLELKSTTGKSSSNRLLFTFTNVEDDRGPLNSVPFPNVQIFDGAGSLRFGTEASSTFNYLKQSTFNLSDQFKYTTGKHTLNMGFEAEYYKAFNSFIQNTTGSYQYDNVSAFLNDLKPRQYIVGFPLIGNNNEQSTDAAAKFNVFRGALYFGDDLKVNSKLSFTFGVRADYTKFLTTPIVDPFAVDSALPKFQQYYDMRGAVPGKAGKVPLSISPRAGFTYKIPEEGVTIRGGIGLFSGRIPMVWPGGIYNNNGISSGSYTLNTNTNKPIWDLDKVRFRTTPYSPTEVGVTVNNVKGQLNLMSETFKATKILRSNLAIDKNLGNGWNVTFEGIYSKNINDIYYQNVNLLPPTLRSTGPDNRLVYGTLASAANTIPIRSNGTNPYSSGVYLITNAPGDLGYSYSLSAVISKTTRTGFSLYASYNYGSSTVLNESQSSTSNSQWGGQESINGRNYITRSISDNDPGHRVFAFISKKFTYARGSLATTVGLTYTGQSGAPYSFVYNNNAVRDGQTFQDLIFVPTSEQLQAMTFITNSSVSAAPAVQKAAFEQYIMNDPYLKTRRGQYAERNGSRTQFTNVVDLRLAQDFNLKISGKTHSFQIVYNMFNFTNFLNRDWGHQYYAAFDQAPTNLYITYASGTVNPQYSFLPTAQNVGAGIVTTTTTPSYASRWTSQLELRMRF